MRITYNGVDGLEGIITFTDIPNILKVEDVANGNYATLTLTFSNDLSSVTTGDGQWYITILGETITNVVNYNNAVNKNFYVAQQTNGTAAYVASALRNCPNIISNFTVEHDSNKVKVKARAIGKIFSINPGWYSTNIASNYMSYTATDGSASSDLAGSIINVNLYTGANDDYVTTLTKNYYGSECAFDMSPLLTTIAKYGDTIPYKFKIDSIKDGEYTHLGDIENGYITPGYMCNQGAKYLSASYFYVAQNFNRGEERDTYNNSLLYVYEPSISLSVFNGGVNSCTFNVKYLNSAKEVIGSGTTSMATSSNTKKIWDATLVLDEDKLEKAFYVDVEIDTQTAGSKPAIRYNVIKPVKATEYSQRILWRNSYGGISFFDFTGSKSETRDVNVTTYQKSIFNYYTNGRNELDMVYDNDVKYTVTLKSHMFENDGKYIFNDLMQSGYVWTEINNETYTIIIESVSVEEVDRNGIYEATVKYRYSQKPSLL